MLQKIGSQAVPVQITRSAIALPTPTLTKGGPVVTDNIINAQSQFGRSQRPDREQTPEERERLATARRLARQQELQRLKEELTATKRLKGADRVAIVRNFGRLIERAYKGQETRIAGQLFRHRYGEEGGLSMEKKRKRYIRFEGEPLPDHTNAGEYAASGSTFAMLFDTYVELRKVSTETEDFGPNLLAELLRGTSFTQAVGNATLHRDKREIFQHKIDAFLDWIAHKTDIVGYFEEIKNYKVSWIEDAENSADLRKELRRIKRYVHHSEELENQNAKTASRLFRPGGTKLVLDDFHGGMLLPRVRIARLFWPRRVLCLNLGVPREEIDHIYRTPLTKPELTKAKTQFGDIPTPELTEMWRKHAEMQIQKELLRSVGLDPDDPHMWDQFESDVDQSAIGIANWRTIWMPCSVDLILGAVDEPESLRLGISCFQFHERSSNLLQIPKHDEQDGCDVSIGWFSDTDSYRTACWYPDGSKYFVSRGISRDQTNPRFDKSSKDDVDREVSQYFEDEYPDLANEFEDGDPVDVCGALALSILSLSYCDWDHVTPSFGDTEYAAYSQMPAVRLLFDAPEGWTPMPDDTLASAILRSLAYGTGANRIDQKLAESIDLRVNLLRDMRQRLEKKFTKAMQGNMQENDTQ